MKGIEPETESIPWQVGVLDSLSTLSFSIGYAGLDTVIKSSFFTNNTQSNCNLKIAKIQNKAGAVVSAYNAQSAVRSRISVALEESLCPGFGICADISDPNDVDAWPITAVTVNSFKICLIE
jgi:hypothetical protein